MNDTIQIAIDGPVGVGKSTVAREVARRLQIIYLDTGAMYRAVGLKSLRLGIDVDDEQALQNLLQHTQLEVRNIDGVMHMVLDGEDVSDLIRTPEVSMAASDVSRWPQVRTALVALQQRLAAGMSVVMEGRDIATVVLPGAQHKFFLVADVQARAQRRALDMRAAGRMVDMQVLTQEIQRRDTQDSTRETSPLRCAPDARKIDTTALTFEEVVAEILKDIDR